MKSFKKVIVIALTGLCLMTSLAHAADAHQDNKIHSSKSPGKMLKKVGDYYPFEVWVKNRSNYIINLDVPEAGIHDTLYPGDDDEIYAYDYYSGIDIVLSRTDGSVFFDGYVRNHHTVWVNDALSASHKLKASLK